MRQFNIIRSGDLREIAAVGSLQACLEVLANSQYASATDFFTDLAEITYLHGHYREAQSLYRYLIDTCDFPEYELIKRLDACNHLIGNHETNIWAERCAPSSQIYCTANKLGGAVGHELYRRLLVDDQEEPCAILNWLDIYKRTFDDKPTWSHSLGSGEQTRQRRRVIVSGMGWSGSGAVLDYLRACPNVEVLDYEYPFFDSCYGLIQIYEELETNGGLFNDEVRRRVQKYFGYLVHGGLPACDMESFLFARDARFYRKSRGELYSRSAKSMMFSIMNSVENYGHPSTPAASAADAVLDFIDVIAGAEEKNSTVYDNIIHIGTALEFSKSMPTVQFVCVFRDPRSNYADLIKSSPGPVPTVQAFVDHYRSCMSTVVKLSGQSLSTRSNVTAVSFEEFVLDGDYRRRLAASLGIDRPEADHSEFFEGSRANIDIFRDVLDEKTLNSFSGSLSTYFSQWI